MLSTNREEFDAQVSTLCAGFNIPATQERKDAFWTGLSKMTLIEFTRCVEFALSEEGPDKPPIPKAIWKLHREIKSKARAGTQSATHRVEEPDHLLYYAHRMFLRHVANRGGLGSEELSRARAALRDTVAWFSGPIREGDQDATPHAFVSALITALGKVSRIDPRAQSEWESMIDHPDAHVPFPAYMGRELPAEQPRQLEMA